MSVAKIIEISCEGKTIEEAINAGIQEAAKTVKNIKHVDVKHVHAHVNNNKVSFFRVIAKISFVIEG